MRLIIIIFVHISFHVKDSILMWNVRDTNCGFVIVGLFYVAIPKRMKFIHSAVLEEDFGI
jgi:urea transporter